MEGCYLALCVREFLALEFYDLCWCSLHEAFVAELLFDACHEALQTLDFGFGLGYLGCGILCGSMANPMALSYANDTLKGDMASVSYASVYPLGMFVRVVIAQMLIMIFV